MPLHTSLADVVRRDGAQLADNYDLFCQENRDFDPVNPMIVQAIREGKLDTPWMQAALALTEARFAESDDTAETAHAAINDLMVEAHWLLVTQLGMASRPAVSER